MNSVEWMGFLLALVVMFIGLIGTVLPGVPGAPLILIAAVGHKLYFQDAGASWLIIVVLGILALLSLLLDFLGTMLGAKKLGATWRGILGATIGAIVGLFFSLPGLILGPVIGAFLFEMLGGREWKESARAGAGALLGLVLGAIGKAVCCVMMIALFSFSVLFHSGSGTTGTHLAGTGAGTEASRAAMKPRALAMVSSYSASGEESATIPAPAWK